MKKKGENVGRRGKKRRIKEEWITLSLCLSSSRIAEGDGKINHGLGARTHACTHTEMHTVGEEHT